MNIDIFFLKYTSKQLKVYYYFLFKTQNHKNKIYLIFIKLKSDKFIHNPTTSCKINKTIN